VPEGSDAKQAHGRPARARHALAREGGDADKDHEHLARARCCRCSSGQGKERRLKRPRARAHRRRCCLLRRLHPAHDQAPCGKQAGGGQPPRRGPSAVAAGASGLQLQSHRQPHPSIRRGRSSIRGAVDGAAHDRRGRPRLRKPRILARRVGVLPAVQTRAPLRLLYLHVATGQCEVRSRVSRPLFAAAAVATTFAVAAVALATAATAALAAADLLGDHLLQRFVFKGSCMEPQLLRWHHAQRRRVIPLELQNASGCGVWRNVHPEHD